MTKLHSLVASALLVAVAACSQADKTDTATMADSATVAATPLDSSMAATTDGVANANDVAEATLAGFPHMDSAKAAALVAARPFATILDLNQALLAQGLTQQQATEFYQSAFVPIDLNTASREQMLLIPGVGPRMAHELEEYRPWTTWAQFDREIGKYVDQAEVARLKRYVTMAAE
jgi:DNA uptake protein ComE-like DNA-binding protein